MLKRGLVRYNGKLSRKDFFILMPLLVILVLALLLAPGCSSSSEPVNQDESGLTPPANSGVIPEVGDGDFEAKVIKSNLPVLVYFMAITSSSCNMFSKIIEKVVVDYTGRLQFYQLDIYDNPNTPANYGISSVPAVLFFRNGQIVDKAAGILTKSNLASFIDKNLGNPAPAPTTTGAYPTITIAPPGTTSLSSAETTYYRILYSTHGQATVALDILSEIKLMAQYFAPSHYMTCKGDLLPAAEFESLFSILGNQFGGDGIATFALPDLSHQPPLNGLSYYMCFEGVYPAATSGSNGNQLQYCPLEASYDLYIGDVVLIKTSNAASLADRLLPCDGGVYSISQYSALFSLVDKKFGGDGIRTFAVPDLRSAASPVVGASFYIVCNGVFPPRN